MFRIIKSVSLIKIIQFNWLASGCISLHYSNTHTFSWIFRPAKNNTTERAPSVKPCRRCQNTVEKRSIYIRRTANRSFVFCEVLRQPESSVQKARSNDGWRKTSAKGGDEGDNANGHQGARFELLSELFFLSQSLIIERIFFPVRVTVAFLPGTAKSSGMIWVFCVFYAESKALVCSHFAS